MKPKEKKRGGSELFYERKKKRLRFEEDLLEKFFRGGKEVLLFISVRCRDHYAGEGGGEHYVGGEPSICHPTVWGEKIVNLPFADRWRKGKEKGKSFCGGQ